MNETLQIRLMGEPKPQLRPRSFGGRTISPKKNQHEYLAQLADKAPEKPITGAVFIHVSFSMPNPKNYRKFHISKPDIDNLLKAVFDNLVKTGYIDDDVSIVQTHAVKSYCVDGMPPNTLIRIESLERQDNAEIDNMEAAPKCTESESPL